MSHLQPLSEVDNFLGLREAFHLGHQHLRAFFNVFLRFENARHRVDVVDRSPSLRVKFIVCLSEVVMVFG